MTDPTSMEPQYVVLTEEPNLMRAHWVAGAVEAAGIPIRVDEDNLADEFAVSQKAMGLIPFRVYVPKDRLEEARAVFLNLSQPIPLVDEDEEDAELAGGDKKKPIYLVTAGLFAATAIIGTVLIFLSQIRSCTG